MKIKAYDQFITQRKDKSLYRSLPISDFSRKNIINFSSNDYLGLNYTPIYQTEIARAGYETALKYGNGATASRFVGCNPLRLIEIEAQFAHLKNREAVFLGASGYQMNIGVIAALLHKELFEHSPLVIFDKYNHASMYDGVRLSGAEMVRYRHNDMNHLEDILKKYALTKRQIFIMTESIFSMDGDMCDLASLMRLAEKYNAFTLVDDAHATGILGHNGAGLTANFPQIDVVIGTLSKALGLHGGYVSCSQGIMNYLHNRAGGMIYSTGISPFIWGALGKTLDFLPNLNKERTDVLQKSLYLRQKLHDIGIDTLNANAHIIPIIMPDIITAQCVEAKLHDEGLYLKAIRAPTVPMNLPRLRLALSPIISHRDIDLLIDIIKHEL